MLSDPRTANSSTVHYHYHHHPPPPPGYYPVDRWVRPFPSNFSADRLIRPLTQHQPPPPNFGPPVFQHQHHRYPPHPEVDAHSMPHRVDSTDRSGSVRCASRPCLPIAITHLTSHPCSRIATDQKTGDLTTIRARTHPRHLSRPYITRLLRLHLQNTSPPRLLQ